MLMPAFAVCESFKGVKLNKPEFGQDIIRFRVEVDGGFLTTETIGLIEGVDHILNVFEKLKDTPFEKQVSVRLFKDNEFHDPVALGERLISLSEANDGILLKEWNTDAGEIYRLTCFAEIRDG